MSLMLMLGPLPFLCLRRRAACHSCAGFFSRRAALCLGPLENLASFARVRTGTLWEFPPILKYVRMCAQCCILGKLNPRSHIRVKSKRFFMTLHHEINRLRIRSSINSQSPLGLGGGAMGLSKPALPRVRFP
jgi:hypothetical protein